jgi:hypothetical protein
MNIVAQKIKISSEQTKRSDENCSVADDADTSGLLGFWCSLTWLTCCTGVSNEALAQAAEPVWLSHASKPNLTRTVFQSAQIKEPNRHCTCYARSGRCNIPRRRNQSRSFALLHSGRKVEIGPYKHNTNIVQRHSKLMRRRRRKKNVYFHFHVIFKVVRTNKMVRRTLSPEYNSDVLLQ